MMHTKALLTTTAILLASTSFAFAQTTGGPGSEVSALASTSPATGTSASTDNGLNRAQSRVADEFAEAVLDNGLGGLSERRASARVGDGVVTLASGNDAGPANIGFVNTPSDNIANTNVQFQAGDDNIAINMQVGTNNQSATLQIGDDNMALISQNGDRHEAAVASVGNDNTGIIVQDGWDHAAAIAQLGNDNMATALQAGGSASQEGNFAAHGQFGNDNTSVSYQDGLDNTLASLQLGDDNHSYINQGGPKVASINAINGLPYGLGTLPSNIDVSGSAIGTGGNRNAAASLQLGDDNRSGILQYGDGNEAVNYQDSR